MSGAGVLCVVGSLPRITRGEAMRFDSEYDDADWEQWQDEIGDQMIEQAEMENRHVDRTLR